MRGYREHRPPPELEPWVECFWTRAGAAPGAAFRVLPDGCADLLVDLAGGRPGAFVVGPMTRTLVVPDGARAAFAGVRFLPGAAAAFLGLPLRELLDLRVDLAEVWRDGAEVAERVASSRGAVATLAKELVRRRARAAAPDPRISAAVRRLAGGSEATSVARLAAELGMSRQHLTRRFAEEVGYGPKRLAKVLRFRRAVGLLALGRPLVAVALAAGYYDQQHLCADFRELAGASPSALRAALHSSKTPAAAAVEDGVDPAA